MSIFALKTGALKTGALKPALLKHQGSPEGALETIGAPDRNRTRDLRFTKPLLYQLSYKGINCLL